MDRVFAEILAPRTGDESSLGIALAVQPFLDRFAQWNIFVSDFVHKIDDLLLFGGGGLGREIPFTDLDGLFRTVRQVWTKRYSNGQPVCGMGFYSRSSTEFVLLGARGKVMGLLTQARYRLPQELASTRGRYSEKPREMYKRIEQYVLPDTRKVELFARDAARPGWTTWGQEVERSSQ